VFIGIFGTIFPFGLYFKGSKQIKSTNAGITATLHPISAGVIAALFLGEAMVPLQIQNDSPKFSLIDAFSDISVASDFTRHQLF
jgi:hypothetical protein